MTDVEWLQKFALSVNGYRERKIATRYAAMEALCKELAAIKTHGECRCGICEYADIARRALEVEP